MTTQAQLPLVVRFGNGPTYRVVADLVTFKAVAEDTGGAYSLFEDRTLPGMGTPPHIQRYEDEAFFVLEGTYTFLIGEQQQEMHAGDYAFVPRGTAHAFTNTGQSLARMLVLVSPGGIHEQFFAEAGELVADPTNMPAPDGPPDVPRLVAIAAKYGIEILLPPAVAHM
jgi:quercetin dioxygenase-like cupin family protein